MTALPALRRAPRRSPATSRPPLRVVVVSARHRAAWVVASLGVMVLAVLAAVSLSAMAADESARIAELDALTRVAEVTHGQLVTEVAALESPARIAAEAERLGLVRVDHPRRLDVQRLLPADGVVHDDGPVGRGSDLLKPLLAQD